MVTASRRKSHNWRLFINHCRRCPLDTLRSLDTTPGFSPSYALANFNRNLSGSKSSSISSINCAFCLLQVEQAITKFSFCVSLPPCTRGTMWSSVASTYRTFLSQYAHMPASRKKNPLTESSTLSTPSYFRQFPLVAQKVHQPRTNQVEHITSVPDFITAPARLSTVNAPWKNCTSISSLKDWLGS